MQKLADRVEFELAAFRIAYPDVREKWQKDFETPHRKYPVGSFTLHSIEDSSSVLTQDSLAGQFYLLAVVYAIKDEQQFGFYQLLHNRFARKGLRFVFLLYRNEEFTATWEELRSAGFRLPGFVASTDQAEFEKKLFPSPGDYIGNIYLVDSNGIVVQSNMSTRFPEFLYWTLERVFDDLP